MIGQTLYAETDASGIPIIESSSGSYFRAALYTSEVTRTCWAVKLARWTVILYILERSIRGTRGSLEVPEDGADRHAAYEEVGVPHSMCGHGVALAQK